MRRDLPLGQLIVEILGQQERISPAASMPRAAAKSSPRTQDDKASSPASSTREFVIKNVREFHASYQPSGGNGGVFCPTRSKLKPGDPVSVRVRLGRRQPPMMMYGRVAWRRPGRHLLKIRAGIGVEFLPSERLKCDYLLDLANAGTGVRSRRRHERVLVDLPITWRPVGSTEGLPGKLRDIGRGGAFVLSPATVPDESQVVLELVPPGAQVPMAFTGRVAWTGKTGLENVFGIEWRARDAGGGRRIKELVRRLTAPPGGA
ncbi:MAG: PilZ domain-containing protein [Deltaproteobacteria bacterium]|nr:PilZ domain-containing protein [Deltaproteobacteria bacterium]